MLSALILSASTATAGATVKWTSAVSTLFLTNAAGADWFVSHAVSSSFFFSRVLRIHSTSSFAA